jgi:hypothetical protein
VRERPHGRPLADDETVAENNFSTADVNEQNTLHRHGDISREGLKENEAAFASQPSPVSRDILLLPQRKFILPR